MTHEEKKQELLISHPTYNFWVFCLCILYVEDLRALISGQHAAECGVFKKASEKESYSFSSNMLSLTYSCFCLSYLLTFSRSDSSSLKISKTHNEETVMCAEKSRKDTDTAAGLIMLLLSDNCCC